jgi:type IV pilus assembly protein PilM
MARKSAIWGIDIGQCALKALRCRPADEDDQVLADAFDFIEYPKILSQPEANPEELIAEALKTFLSRNSVRGDRVAVSVSGQSGLARFIKLPPVESKKIPDIVKYEARQQIPFALEDVVWDYQQMPGGSVEEGFALETEVGLFAMKRDQVFRALKPFDAAGIEVDYIQLAPLALYNFVAFDQMQDLPPADQYDPDAPPPSVVVLSLGTDTTDLVVTNGYRVWQRSVPVGGNHFTRALTKELKLTFAKAEHLKRNSGQSENAKAIFQAMRPVFNDLLTEVQRSLGYFSSIDRRAKIGRIVGLGNAMKLPGLQRYLQQNLNIEVQKLDKFRGLAGADVTDAPAFKDNLLAFGTCYGLALQGLRETKIRTNLLPPELAKDRLIRDKKPWAVAAAAVLLLGMTVNTFGHRSSWASAQLEGYFAGPKSEAESVASQASQYSSSYEDAKTQLQNVTDVGNRLVNSVTGRTKWLELMTAIDAAIPRDAAAKDKGLAKLNERDEVHVESIECAQVPELSGWWGVVQPWWKPVATPKPAADPAATDGSAAGAAPVDGAPAAEAPAADAMVDPTADPAATDPAADPGPAGPGWIFEIKGYHYHNKEEDTENEGPAYLRKTLLKNLLEQKVTLPGPDGKPRETTLAELGISYPVLINPGQIHRHALSEKEGAAPIHVQAELGDVRRFDFVVQFCWRDPALTAAAATEETDTLSGGF